MTVVEHHNLLDGETVGILAGWGRFSVAVAEAVHRRGGKTAILSIRHHANAMLQDVADYHGFVGVAEIGKAIDFFRSSDLGIKPDPIDQTGS